MRPRRLLAVATLTLAALPGGARAAATPETVRSQLEAGHVHAAAEHAARLLARAEADSGPEGMATARALVLHARALEAAGRLSEAERAVRRGLQILESQPAGDAAWRAEAQLVLARVLESTGDYAAGEAAARDALRILEATGVADAPAEALDLLALLRHARGDFETAESLLARARHLREESLGASHPRLAPILNDLVIVLFTQGRYREAGAHARRALELTAQLDPDHPDRAEAANGAGALAAARGAFAEAELHYRRALASRRRRLGEDHHDTATSLNNLGTLLHARGNLAGAEALLQRALEIRERALGARHPLVASSLGNLATLLGRAGRYAEAMHLGERALAILEHALGPRSVALATALGNHALLHEALGDARQAEALFHRALDVYRSALHEDSPVAAATRNNHAAFLARLGRQQEAERLYRDTLARLERVAPRHPVLVNLTNNLGAALLAQGHAAEGEALLRRSLDVARETYGLGHPDTAGALNNLAALLRARQRPGEAEALLAQALQAAREADRPAERVRLARNMARLALDGPDRARALPYFAEAMDAVDALFAGTRGLREETRTVFVGQFAPLFREALALLLELHVARPDAGHAARFVETLSRHQSRVFSELLQGTTAGASPLAPAPEPVSVAQVQALLARDEAVLAYALLDDETVAVVVRSDAFRIVRLPIGPDSLRQLVRLVRSALESVARDGLSALRLLDPAQLHLLHLNLVVPVEEQLAGVQRLLVIGDGPLHTLPLGMLVSDLTGAAPSAARDALLGEFAGLRYVADRYELSYLPSLAALRALRQRPAPGPYARTLVAFADPDVAGADGVSAALEATLRAYAGAEWEPGALPRLEHAALEARAIAERLGGATTVHVGAAASERQLAEESLVDARFVLFATHGFLGGDFNVPGARPALALSRSDLREGDDGLLDVAEVMRLELDAELVALSACSTAGEVEAARNGEGFAGLTRAFMHAGARNLLVTHWEVETHASRLMMESLFDALAGARDVGGALGTAQRALRSQTLDFQGARISLAHPFFWAPFVHVGAGSPSPDP